MASIMARQMLARRMASHFQPAAKIHTFSGAVSSSVVKLKPGGANGLLDTTHKVMPEISKICDGTWAATRGVVSCMSVSSVPEASTMCGFNVWPDVETVQKLMPKASQVYAQLADHYDLSVEPQRAIAEADIIDFGLLQPSDKYQPAVLALGEFPTKPGAAKPYIRKFMADKEMHKQMQDGFGIAYEMVTYPTESSMLFRLVFKDFAAYAHFRSAAVQEKMAAFWADTGFMEIIAGAPFGRTVFPDAHVLVKCGISLVLGPVSHSRPQDLASIDEGTNRQKT